MSIKKIFSALLTSQLLASGLVLSSVTSASAVDPTPSLYTVNVANQSSSGEASDFIRLGNKTYFFAETLSDGLAVWSLADTVGAQPQLVVDIAEGVINGRAAHLAGFGDYLYFYLNDAFNGQGGYQPAAYNLVTHTLTKMTYPGTSEPMVDGNYTNFVQVGSDVYFAFGGELDQSLYKFAPSTAALTLASDMGSMLVENNYRGGTVSNGQGNFPTIVAFGSKIYIAEKKSIAPPGGSYCSGWGYSDWAELRAYDTTSSSWDSAVQVDGSALVGVAVLGTWNLNGEEVFLSAAASSQGCYFNHTFKYYVTKSNGTTTQLGTWTTNGGIWSFVNLDAALYSIGNGFGLIDPITGENTNMGSTMFPSGGDIAFVNAVQVDDELVFAARLGNYSQPQYLYRWDGAGAAVHLDTVPLGQAVDIAPNSSSIYEWYRNADQRYESRYAIGVVGARAITNFIVDPAVGGEPYLVGLDNTKTLVKNFNIGSDGSDPDTDCFANFNNFDYIAGNLPLQSASWGKDVFVELKGEDGYLKYSVIDPGNLENMCGFTVINGSLYLSAEDPETNDSALYKMATDRTITHVHDLPDESEQGFTNGTDYFYRQYNYYATDLFMWEASTNSVIQLTGSGSDLVEEDEVDEAVVLGNYLYFVGDSESNTANNGTYLWRIDMSNPTAPPVPLTAGDAGSSNPENLNVVDGKLVFADDKLDVLGQSVGESVYQYNPVTGIITEILDPDPIGDEGYVERIFAVGTDVVVSYNNQTKGWDVNDIFRGALAGPINGLILPDGFEALCAAPAGNDIAISDNEGNGYFYKQGGDSMVPIEYSFAGDTWALCDSVSSENGTYLSMPEYPFDDGPWASEPGYLGFLTPLAVERLGETVNEPPATPYSETPPPADAPGTPGAPNATVGDGSIDLTWSAPSTGGTPGGYTIESSPAGAICVIVGTSASCTGLVPGTSYSFTVKAYNVNGFGATSGSSNSAIAPQGSDSGFGGGGSDGGGSDGGGSDGGGSDGGGSDGGGSDGGGSDNSEDGAGSGGLSLTGFDPLGMIVFAFVLLTFGAVATGRWVWRSSK